MARKPRRDENLDASDGSAAEADDAPSRTSRKHASEELQGLGEKLVALPDAAIAALPFPETLKDALLDAKRLPTFGAQRRQAQFIGKLMRRLDDGELAAARAAAHDARGPSLKATVLLHRAERRRDALLADDAELERWLAEFPRTDAQQLRALIRRARLDERATKPGEAVRRGRAYREIFMLVRDALAGMQQR
jgi:ribosome-associated protein